jgi:hypothetical protein
LLRIRIRGTRAAAAGGQGCAAQCEQRGFDKSATRKCRRVAGIDGFWFHGVV